MHHPFESLESRQLLSASVVTPNKTPIEPLFQPVGVTIHTEATDQFSGTVGKLENYVPIPVAADAIVVGQRITINWGDGQTSTGTLAAGSKPREVLIKGSHTYSKTGTFNVTTTITWGPIVPVGTAPTTTANLAPLAVVHSKADVSADDDGGVTLHETAGKSFTASVGSFDFRSIDVIAQAVIDWGDGTQSAGTIGGSFVTGERNVIGTHKYAKAGKYTVHVKVLTSIAPRLTPAFTFKTWKSTINVS